MEGEMLVMVPYYITCQLLGYLCSL